MAARAHVVASGAGAAPLSRCAIDAVTPALGRGAARARRAPHRPDAPPRASAAPAEAVGAPSPRAGRAGFELGRHVGGDQLLPTRRGRVRDAAVAATQDRARRSARPDLARPRRCCASPMASPRARDWCVFVHRRQRRPAHPAALRRADGPGRAASRGCSQHEPYDGWRGDGREIANRLVQLIDWADEGGGTYYRDLQSTSSALACTAPDGPPRSSAELLARLDRGTARRPVGRHRARRPGARRVQGRADRRLPPALRRLLRRHRRPARRRLGLRGHRLRLPAAQRARSTARRRQSSRAS